MSERVRAYAALAVGVVAVGWSAIFVRWTAMPGIASAFYRVFLAAVLLWPLLLWRRAGRSESAGKTGSKRAASRRMLGIAALGGVCFAGDLGCFNVAVLHTSAGAATLLGNNAPIFVGLLTWAITRRAPARRFWLALVVSLVGGALIVLPDARQMSFQMSFSLRSGADLLAVAASLCFALYLVVTERARASFAPGKLLALSSTASAATLLVVAAVTRTSLAIPSGRSWLAVLGLAVICQLIGYFSLTYAMGHLPATVTSIGFLGVGPLTALFALLLFGERMSWLQVLGGALVLVGIWIAGGLASSRAEAGAEAPSCDIA